MTFRRVVAEDLFVSSSHVMGSVTVVETVRAHEVDFRRMVLRGEVADD